MRVVICVKHNALMEAPRPASAYLVCFKCKEQGRRGDPNWFPIAFANRNHKDGSMKRTWVSRFDRWTTSKWKWERVKEEK